MEMQTRKCFMAENQTPKFVRRSAFMTHVSTRNLTKLFKP